MLLSKIYLFSLQNLRLNFKRRYHLMTDNDREKIALFRFALISPILNRQVQNQKECLSEITAKTHNVPYYGRSYNAGLGITSGADLML